MLSDALGRAAQIGRLAGNPTVLALTSTTSTPVALKAFTAYRFFVTADCWIKFGIDNTVVATVATGHPLKAGIAEAFRTDATNVWITGILASGTGNLHLSEIEI